MMGFERAIWFSKRPRRINWWPLDVFAESILFLLSLLQLWEWTPPIYQTPLLGTLKLDRRPGRLLDHLQYSLPVRQPTYRPILCEINFTYLLIHDSSGRSVYQVGLLKAFDLLKASAVGEFDKTKRRIILFLTDGDPTDDRDLIFKTIRDKNLELNNSVIIFTFGIDTHNPEILTDIANQNTTKYGYPRNVSVGDVTVKYM